MSEPIQATYSPATFRPLTFFDAVARFEDGTDSPRRYLERCLGVIAEREGVVKAWVVIDEAGAREAADRATERYRAGRPLSPIDGMPIGIKDLIETKDMPTQMGSPAFSGNHPRRDSALVQALRQAGAVVLGKTVTTELGLSHPGPTTNPFDPRRTPGGSSSGSGAAVGAAMVPVAIGTQVGGSVIRPASFCANHALKPTFGALNRGERQGLSQSHVGVHAGSLADMWSVAIEIARRAGGDPGHPGLFGPAELPPAMKPARLIVMATEGWPLLDAASIAAFEQILAALRRAGIEVLTRASDPLIAAFEESIAESLAMTRDLCAFEMRWSLENLVEHQPDKVSDSLRGRLALGRRLGLDDYRRVLQRREEARRRHAAIAPLGDALISLASAGPAPLAGDSAGSERGILHTTGSPAFNAATSLLGAPAITVPLIAVANMPLGVQLVGQPHLDARLAGMARWLAETITPVSV